MTPTPPAEVAPATCAKLAHKGEAPIEQIQQSLGVELDLLHAPSDYIRLDVQM